MNDPTCSHPGCPKRPHARGMCAVHYNAARDRREFPDLPPPELRPPKIHPGDTRPHSSGYTLVYSPGHIISPRRPHVFQHRLVMFDIIGYGPHRCGHCATHINWGAGLEVDHLDYQRDNNDPSNLLQSCHGCNTRRARHANQFTVKTAP